MSFLRSLPALAFFLTFGHALRAEDAPARKEPEIQKFIPPETSLIVHFRLLEAYAAKHGRSLTEGVIGKDGLKSITTLFGFKIENVDAITFMAIPKRDDGSKKTTQPRRLEELFGDTTTRTCRWVSS